jgi:hypothetical protein
MIGTPAEPSIDGRTDPDEKPVAQGVEQALEGVEYQDDGGEPE